MALSQSALLEVLDALKAGESVEMIRDAVQVILQELIEAEATAVIGAVTSAPSPGSCNATATVTGPSRLRPVTSSWASEGGGRGRSSRPCWSRVAGSTRRCTRW